MVIIDFVWGRGRAGLSPLSLVDPAFFLPASLFRPEFITDSALCLLYLKHEVMETRAAAEMG